MYNITQAAENFKRHESLRLLQNEALAPRSSFKIGGKAALLLEPENTKSLCLALTFIKKEKIPYFVLGGGTNVLFDDQDFDGIVVSTKKLCGLEIIEKNQGEEGAAIRAKAGSSVASLVSFAEKNSLSGLEEFAGLPGTVGGALYMNARCFDREMSNVAGKIAWIEWSREEDSFVQKEEIFPSSEWQYKKSPFSNSEKIIVEGQFLVSPGQAEEIVKKGAGFVQERKDKGHYKFPCAGSVFKNNRSFGRPTGKIIDELGLKGSKIGGAQIAPFHGNIIVNVGGAKAKDVLALIDLCKKKAKETFGFDLEEEIIFVKNA